MTTSAVVLTRTQLDPGPTTALTRQLCLPAVVGTVMRKQQFVLRVPQIQFFLKGRENGTTLMEGSLKHPSRKKLPSKRLFCQVMDPITTASFKVTFGLHLSEV